ncbi:MAG: sigma-70 family RNA polymerase sigma factor [Acidimicrobiales bacterium]
MTSTEPRTDIFEHRADEPVSEQLLLQAVRDGSTGAFGVLYARHRTFAVGVARRALGPSASALAEDVAEGAFIDVLTALRNGKGPTDGLRSYLATAVRHQAWRTQRRHRRQADSAERWTAGQAAEPTPGEPDLPVDDDGLGSHALLATAYRGLSERWRHVLWLTEVEGRRPADIAPLLGISAGTAAALAYRARQGLLAAYITAYRSVRTDPTCQAHAARLAELVAAGPDAPGFDDVRDHLAGCASCRDLARGVDLGVDLGVGLGALAPFGALTAGWWAKGLAVEGARLGGALGGAAAAVGGRGARALGGGGGGAGGGVVGAVAVAVAAVAVVAGAASGLARDGDAGRPEAAAGAAADAATPGPDAAVAGIEQDAPPSTATPDPTAATTPSSAAAPVASTTVTAPAVPLPATVPPSPAAVPTVPRPGAAPSTTIPPSTTVPATTTTTIPPSTTVPATTTTTTTTIPPSSTTTIPESPVAPGALGGRITVVDPATDAAAGLPGVRVVAAAWGERHEATTDADGRWSIAALPAGRYLVVADVPAAYRPSRGLDPWLGGPTWPAVLGVVEVADVPLDLVDLRLTAR